jgi:hypothetical protein
MRRAGSITLLPALMLLAATISAQPRAAVRITLPASPASDAPSVFTEHILADGRIRDHLTNGWPARLHFRLERWGVSEGVFNKVKATAKWDVIVSYDGLNKSYRVGRIHGRDSQRLGEFEKFEEVEALLERHYRPTIKLPAAGEKSYYEVNLEVETMSVSDLDELQSWLRGEAKPALKGRRNVGGALWRGIKTSLLRIVGAERREYYEKTSIFVP